MSGLLILAAIELVSGGQARLKLESDGSQPAEFAAELLRGHVVLLTGTALPATGQMPALRLKRGPKRGYDIRVDAGEVVIEGADLVRAAYDLLESWGCRFDPKRIPRRESLSIEPVTWRPVRELWLEADRFDPSLQASGLAVRGLKAYRKAPLSLVRQLGYGLRVASTSFDDFLPPARFARHPEWFALRSGRRVARGNFALTNAEARAAYLDALDAWLAEHPEVDVIGIWPEVTSVWCQESIALGPPESYALLWREAAARFKGRRFEILATGLTLKPPAGRVPRNVEVRLRPGHDASGLQGIAGQPIEAVVKAWEVRGARVVLEIDAAPESWCGMPWPCHDAIRANARRFASAVLVRGRHLHARLWRHPKTRLGDLALLDRARKFRSWGDPRDAADLFFDARQGMAFRIAATERLYRLAVKENDARAANDVYLGFRAIVSALPPQAAKAYRRYRGRDVRRMLEGLLPEGARRRVGPAEVRETFDGLVIETDTLRIEIDRRRASVVSVKRMQRGEWSRELCAGAFDVVGLRVQGARGDGSVELSSPGTGRLRIDLRGRLKPGGPTWRSRLDLASASGVVRQTSEAKGVGGIATGFTWRDKLFDRWVCPAYATEGRLGEQAAPSFAMPAGTLLYCRQGEQGLGLAARLPHGGRLAVDGGLVATRRGSTIMVDWILFTHTGELAR